MSRTLNLVDGLLLMGRRQQQLGRTQAALTVLTQIAGLRDLPREAAEETQARLGEIQLRRRKFRRAGRHLAAALRYAPDNARYHHLLASALREQGEERWDRAAEHYRRSLELDPGQADCLAEFGLFAVRLGHADEGIERLRQATALRPDDPVLAGKLAEGLRLAGRTDEARTALRAALFRNPRDRRFHALWADFQFHQLRREQQRRQRRAAAAEGPVLLPFITPQHAATEHVADEVVRVDGPTPLPTPHGRGRRLPGRRHVQ